MAKLKDAKQILLRALALAAVAVPLMLAHMNCAQPITPNAGTKASASTAATPRALTVTLQGLPADLRIAQADAVNGFYIKVEGAFGAVQYSSTLGSVNSVSGVPPIGYYQLPSATQLSSAAVPVTIVVQDSGSPVASRTVSFTILSSGVAPTPSPTATASSTPPPPTPSPTPTPTATPAYSYDNPVCGPAPCDGTRGDVQATTNYFCQTRGLGFTTGSYVISRERVAATGSCQYQAPSSWACYETGGLGATIANITCRY